MLVPGDQTDRRAVAHGQVEEAFGDMADAAVADAVELQPVAGGEAGGVGLVGDDAQRAGLRTGAVQRALRAGQRLDAVDVVDVDVQRALDGGDRLFVQVHAHAGQRAGVVAVAAAGHAAHVDLREARARGLVRHAGQVLHVVVEVGDVEVLQLFRPQHLDADRHFLQVLHALLRGHRDGVQGGRAAFALGGRRGGRVLGQGGGAERQVDRGGQRELRQGRRIAPPRLSSAAVTHPAHLSPVMTVNRGWNCLP